MNDIDKLMATLPTREVVVTSLTLAKHFDKNHNNILRDIREVIRKKMAPKGKRGKKNETPWVDDSVEEIVTPWGTVHKAKPKPEIHDWPGFFYKKTYIDSRGKTQPMYEMTRDGYLLIALGFTGEKAMKFKLSLIYAFNKMEEAARKMVQGQKHPVVLMNAGECWELGHAEGGKFYLPHKLVKIRPLDS
jgi:phage regulator Rha-like protein